MSTISAKFSGIPVELDELVSAGVVKMRKATLDALPDIDAEIHRWGGIAAQHAAEASALKTQRDANWNLLQDAKKEIEALKAEIAEMSKVYVIEKPTPTAPPEEHAQ